MITELPVLPHFIWIQIIKYAISEDREDLSLVSSAWFKLFTPYNGRIVNYKLNTGRCYETLPWSKKIVSEICFTKFNRIDWEYLYRFKEIKTIVISLTEIEGDLDEDFVSKLLHIGGINSIILDIYIDNFKKLKLLSFIKDIRLQLKELQLTKYSRTILSEFDNFLEDSFFPKMISFTNCYQGNNIPLEKISFAMPNLKKLTLDMFVTPGNTIVIDYPIPRLKELSLQAAGRSGTTDFYLDLTKYPSLYKLSVFGELLLTNLDKTNFQVKVKDLSLYESTLPLVKSIQSKFSYLRYLNLNCGTVDTENLVEFLKLCDRLKVLILRDLNEENLPTSFPLVSSSLRSFNVQGSDFLTENFITWLTNHDQLRYLKLELKYHEQDITTTEYRSDQLEELYIHTMEYRDMSPLKKIFPLVNFPKLINSAFTE